DVGSTRKASTAPATRTKPMTARAVDRPRVAADVSATSDASAATTAAPIEPAEPPPSKVSKQDSVEVATVALSKVVTALFDSLTGDAPTVPVQTPAVWTLAAAARRELPAASTSLVRPADPVANSLTAGTTPAAVTAPKVVAIEQTAPLAFLQQLPVV